MVDNADIFLLAYYTVLTVQTLKSLGERKGDPKFRVESNFIV